MTDASYLRARATLSLLGQQRATEQTKSCSVVGKSQMVELRRSYKDLESPGRATVMASSHPASFRYPTLILDFSICVQGTERWSHFPPFCLFSGSDPTVMCLK